MTHSITTDPSDTQRAFTLGVKAAAEALDQLTQLDGQPRDAKLKYFWLKVGTELAKAVPYGDPDQITAFVQGASARQPNESELLR